MIGVVMDVTSSKKSEDKYKDKTVLEANSKLEVSQQQIKEISSDLEHQIKRRSKELGKVEEGYRTFIKNNSEGILRYEFEGISYIDIALSVERQVDLLFKHSYIAECNDSLALLYGYKSANELIRKKMSEIFPPSNSSNIESIKKFIRSDYRIREEATIKSNHGDLTYIRRNLIGIVENNKLIRLWGVIKDITVQVKSLEALKESEERYRFLAETAPQICWTSNPDGIPDFYNQKWFEYTGITWEQAKEMGYDPFIHPDDLERVYKTWMESVQTGNSFQTEYRLKRSDGVYKWFLGRSLPLKDKEGNIIKWAGTATDIDDQKKYSEELKDKNEELKRINLDLDNFIYTASHDLKAPISNIEGLLNAISMEMSEECKLEGENLTLLKMIDTSVNKFKKTIFDLTEIAQVQKSGEESIQDNNVSEVLDEVELLLHDQIKTSVADIKTDLRNCSVIRFSRRNLQRILYNLLSNAIKFRSPQRHPKIFISTECSDNYVVLSIKDNGLGFDPNQAHKIFRMFKRLHAHTEGTGVGLYLVKRMITNAGGRIEAESEKGKGTVFKVYFKG